MAKRGRRVNIGAALGSVADRIDAWKAQRDVLAAEVNALAKAAQAMMTTLVEGKTDETNRFLASARAPRNKGGRLKGYKMSAATKAKLRAAWKKRKAAAKATKTGVKAFLKGKPKKKGADSGSPVGNG